MFERIFGMKALAKGIDIQGELPDKRDVYHMFFKISWPAAMEGLLIMLISSVDLIMVGALGTEAVAAVGITSQPRMLILCFSRSLAVAVTAVIARRKGEGRQDELAACMKQAMLVNFIMSVILLAVSLVFIEQIVFMAGADEEYAPLAVSYGIYNMTAVFFMALSVGINAGQTGMGNTKIILYANVSGNLVNTLFNFLLIYGVGVFPTMGVKGAGIATLLGSVTAFGISLNAVMKRNSELTIRGMNGWIPQKNILISYFKVGSSAFAEQVFERIGMFLYSYMAAQLGTVAFAAHYICMNICDIYYAFGQGMSKASSALTGQKLGERRKDLAYICARAGRRAGFVLDICAFLIYFLGRYMWMYIFSKDAAVINIGADLLIFVAVCVFIQTQSMVYSGVLQGAGDIGFIAVYSFWDIAVFRPIFTYLLCFVLGFGIYGAWLALLADQCIRAVCSTKRFYGGKWMRITL